MTNKKSYQTQPIVLRKVKQGGNRTKFESLTSSVEGNIVRLLKKFREKPAVFLSRSDVMCYMYYLLVTDPFLGFSPTITNLSPNTAKSKSFLVHAGLDVSIDDQNKQVTLSVGESQKETDLSGWDFPVGIEIQHNVKDSPTALVTLKEDINKLSSFKRGYLLWLNWDTPIADENIEQAKNLTAEHNNLRFFYVDLCFNPPKSNVRIK